MPDPSTLAISGRGGDELSAWLTRPEGEAGGTGVILIHDVFGLDAHMREVSARLATAGHAVLAPDLFSREGQSESAPEASAQEREARESSLCDREVLADLEAALDALAENPGVDRDRVAAMGLGMGGRLAYLLGCTSTRVAAVVNLCGPVVYSELSAARPVQPLEMALNLGAPLLGLFGEGADSPSRGDAERLRGVLSQFAKDFDIFTYPRAGHGFLDRHRGEYDADAAADAWERILGFLDENLR